MKRRIVRPLILTIMLIISFSVFGCAVGVGYPYHDYYYPDYDYPYYGPSPHFYEHPGYGGHEREEHRGNEHHEQEEHKR